MRVDARLVLAISIAAVSVSVAGCGTVDRTPDPAPPGAGGPVPAIRLDAVEHKLDQLRDWSQASSSKYGIPLRALQAYGYATVVMAKAQPNCHLGWTTLAGIARVESNHARFGGATIAADGSVRPVIRGVALNGTGGNGVIVDPGASASTGHTVYARAMGPFQFIPDTWKRWGVRADADYNALAEALENAKPAASTALSGSPDNIDDAALAAARYLCASGGDLATAHGWRQAILAYNHSGVYVDQVRSAATGYDA
ncbi:lytic transglycosylase domain-containing protein [Nocardia sp. CDC160]|uniref:lytic transglycosylase domain-containing protein n=1 Tax=Nocardia sp. CDC160 TaxID=3112166 RepID=UPI002DBD2662|nr:lytic transglycosylase domain-containing protein [Nocardia sp. CDC160]MEC3917242.1 lytic transglycosylase domain-containing protein [Nocardia sp. CDC160]